MYHIEHTPKSCEKIRGTSGMVHLNNVMSLEIEKYISLETAPYAEFNYTLKELGRVNMV
jgi:hypothetical protein